MGSPISEPTFAWGEASQVSKVSSPNDSQQIYQATYDVQMQMPPPKQETRNLKITIGFDSAHLNLGASSSLKEEQMKQALSRTIEILKVQIQNLARNYEIGSKGSKTQSVTWKTDDTGNKIERIFKKEELRSNLTTKKEGLEQDAKILNKLSQLITERDLINPSEPLSNKPITVEGEEKTLNNIRDQTTKDQYLSLLTHWKSTPPSLEKAKEIFTKGQEVLARHGGELEKKIHKYSQNQILSEKEIQQKQEGKLVNLNDFEDHLEEATDNFKEETWASKSDRRNEDQVFLQDGIEKLSIPPGDKVGLVHQLYSIKNATDFLEFKKVLAGKIENQRQKLKEKQQRAKAIDYQHVNKFFNEFNQTIFSDSKNLGFIKVEETIPPLLNSQAAQEEVPLSSHVQIDTIKLQKTILVKDREILTNIEKKLNDLRPSIVAKKVVDFEEFFSGVKGDLERLSNQTLARSNCEKILDVIEFRFTQRGRDEARFAALTEQVKEEIKGINEKIVHQPVDPGLLQEALNYIADMKKYINENCRWQDDNTEDANLHDVMNHFNQIFPATPQIIQFFGDWLPLFQQDIKAIVNKSSFEESKLRIMDRLDTLTQVYQNLKA